MYLSEGNRKYHKKVLALYRPLTASVNSTLLELFGFKKIRYWQSFRLYLLAAIVIGYKKNARVTFTIKHQDAKSEYEMSCGEARADLKEKPSAK